MWFFKVSSGNCSVSQPEGNVTYRMLSCSDCELPLPVSWQCTTLMPIIKSVRRRRLANSIAASIYVDVVVRGRGNCYGCCCWCASSDSITSRLHPPHLIGFVIHTPYVSRISAGVSGSPRDPRLRIPHVVLGTKSPRNRRKEKLLACHGVEKRNPIHLMPSIWEWDRGEQLKPVAVGT